jgi:DNA-binding PadR family transcriptional regulator
VSKVSEKRNEPDGTAAIQAILLTWDVAPSPSQYRVGFMAGLRITVQTEAVLQAFLAEPEREIYGLEIAAHTGLLPGTTYPILVRLERADWVTSRWENIDPHDEQRPRRRYYKMTQHGIELATEELRRRTEKRAAAARRGGWAPNAVLPAFVTSTLRPDRDVD